VRADCAYLLTRPATDVEVLAIVAKSEAEQWLERFATKAE